MSKYSDEHSDMAGVQPNYPEFFFLLMKMSQWQSLVTWVLGLLCIALVAGTSLAPKKYQGFLWSVTAVIGVAGSWVCKMSRELDSYNISTRQIGVHSYQDNLFADNTSHQPLLKEMLKIQASRVGQQY